MREPTEMELRVAVVLLDADGISLPLGRKRLWIELSEGQRSSYLRTARATIRAQRIPSDEQANVIGFYTMFGDGRRVEFWRDMIDAASPLEST